MSTIFISGIGTGVGKTLVAAILAEALEADYWKPIQAGYDGGTDSEWVQSRVSNKKTFIHPEIYKFKLAASPHIAAREEKTIIDIQKICEHIPRNICNLIIEGPGGLLVPINETEFVADLIRAMDVKVVLVSRNYLGSINHSLLTASVCSTKNIPIEGWIFNDHFMNYENEIVRWTGIPRMASVPYAENADQSFVARQATAIRKQLASWLC
jgi:dethiobiotin synthetase